MLLLIFLDDFFHSWFPNKHGSTKKISVFDVLNAGCRGCLINSSLVGTRLYNICDHFNLTIFVGPSLETAKLLANEPN